MNHESIIDSRLSRDRLPVQTHKRLKPFFDFRNSLVHCYWIIDDSKLIENILKGHADFDRFVNEMDAYLSR